MKKETLRSVTVCAVMGGIGFVLMLLEFPLTFLIPSFIKMDFSELPALVAAFAFGPLYGIGCCAVKNLLHLFVTSSAGIGELSNFLLGAVFTGVAGFVYRNRCSRGGAVLGAVSGAVAMGLVSLVTNYYLIYPFYTAFMPMKAIIAAYRLLIPSADTLWKCLLMFNLPFTVGKGLLDTVVCLLIYKRLSPIFKKGKNNG